MRAATIVVLMTSILVAGIRPAAAEETPPTMQDLLETIEAMRARLEAQDRRIADLERALGVRDGETPPDAIARAIEDYVEGVDDEPGRMEVTWKDGIRFETRDGDFKLKLQTRWQGDAVWAGGDRIEDAGYDLGDGTELRRLRIATSGTIYRDLYVKMQVSFEGGVVRPKGIYLDVRKLPVVGAVKLGSYKEPLSMEEQMSGFNTTFAERSLTTALAPRSNLGITLHDAVLGEKRKQRLTWAAGVFRESDTIGDSRADGEFNVTARVTGLPVYEDGGRLLHLGLAGSYRSSEEPVRFRSRPEVHLLPYLVNTGNLDASRVILAGVEAALVRDGFFVQVESIGTWVDTDDGSDDPFFFGANVQVGWFLTGDHRTYDHARGLFKGVSPRSNFRQDGGWGAFEIGARLSHLDLDDGPVEGGRLTDFTLGVNWYLNPNVRFVANWVHGWLSEPDAELDAFVFRVHADF